MFLRKNNQKMFMSNKKKKRLSLPTHSFKIVLRAKKHKFLNLLNGTHGETSLFTSGSVTVEASFVLSLFILLSAMLLSLFFTLQKDLNLVCELNSSTQKMAVYGSATEDYDGDVVLTNGFVEHISFLPEWVGNFYILEEAQRKPWTGRVIEGENSDDEECEYVYVAENGTVYHTSEGCSHLSLTVSMTSLDTIENCRNEDGGKYRPCEKCGKEANDIVFIAREGDCYHSKRNCSGLKRTYDRLKLTEVNLPPCSRCGK